MREWILPIKDNPLNAIIGQEETKETIKSALLSGRNIIIVGPPGVGKTTLAKSIASIIKAPFIRVQGSPDLTAEDLIGDIDPIKALKYGPLSKEAFIPGKIFKANKGILFFDEINRASEKLQNALLQALEEKKVTISGFDVDLETNFILIGTMNPEDSSTEKLSDVFLDRFDMVFMDYPNTYEEEEIIINNYGQKLVEVPNNIKELIIRFIQYLRKDDSLEKKPSVRATLGLFDRAQTTAVINKKKKVELDDLLSVIVSVLAHRIRLKPSLKYLKSTEEYVMKSFQSFVKEKNLDDIP